MAKKAQLHQFIIDVKDTIRQLTRVVHLVWQSSRALTIANIFLFILKGTLPLLALYILKLVIDTITVTLAAPSASRDFAHIGILISIEGGILLLLALSNVAAAWVRDIQMEVITDYMHNLIHSKSSDVDLEYYENPKYHDILHRSQEEASFRPNKILLDLLNVGQNGVSLLAITSLLFYLHWAIALILFINVVPGILVRLKYSSILYKWKRGSTPKERLAWYFHWILTGDLYVKEIRFLDLGKIFINNYNNIRTQLRDERRTITTKRAISEGISQIGGTLAIVASYFFIAFRTVQGVITIGGLVLYYQAFQQGLRALRELLFELANLYEDSLFVSDMFEFLSLEHKVIEPQHPKSVPLPMQKGIEFDSVSFQYPNEPHRIALQEVSLSICPGETIAIVGENGSGKTTLVKLLCRLYDPTNGSITLDGINLRDFKIAPLRRQFSVLFQDFAHYNLTVRENIGFGDIYTMTDLDKIKEAARCSGADKVIMQLERGYETILGKRFEDGEELSIGEWQKIALARAFLRNAQIVILDEPTSALDAKTEYEIFKNIRKITLGKTNIFISHRFSTVRMADTIYVLDNGRIVECGNHKELISLGGKYAHMFELQAKAYS